MSDPVRPATWEEVERVREALAKAPPAEWTGGGPVQTPTIHMHSEQVWEIGHADDTVPPGLAVVNDYLIPRGRHKGRWSGEDIANLICLMRNTMPALLALIDQMADLLHDARQEPGYALGRAEERREVLEVIGAEEQAILEAALDYERGTPERSRYRGGRR